MKKYDCIKSLSAKIRPDTPVVSNLANTACLLEEIRPSDANFYEVNLGCCTALAMGVALALPHLKVVALDGDGNLLLNLSVLADLANTAPPNLLVIVFDNQYYESGGGFPSVTSGVVDLEGMAKGAGIKNTATVQDLKGFNRKLASLLKTKGPAFLVAKVERDGRIMSRRSTISFQEIKFKFIRHIENTEGVIIVPRTKGVRIEV